MTVDLSVLRAADQAQARAFFADSDAEELVAAVRATSDEALLALIGRDEIRPVAVAGMMARLPEYALPERLAALRGVVRLDLQRRGTLLERYALVFGDGGRSCGPAPTSTGRPTSS